MLRGRVLDVAQNKVVWVVFTPGAEGVPVQTRDGWGYLVNFDEPHNMCLVRLTNTPQAPNNVRISKYRHLASR